MVDARWLVLAGSNIAKSTLLQNEVFTPSEVPPRDGRGDPGVGEGEDLAFRLT